MPELTTKEELENWYEVADPWQFNDSFVDLVRRQVFLEQLRIPIAAGLIHTALDAGCGEGFVTHDLAKSSYMDIDAFDISDNAIRYALEKNDASNTHYYAQDLRDFEVSKHFDLIICEEALYYLEDAERNEAVAKFAESLNPNGFLKLSVVTIGQNEHRAYFTEQSIQDLLLKNGFNVISIGPSVVAHLRFLDRILFFVMSRLYRVVRWRLLVMLGRHIVSTYQHSACYQLSILARKR